MGGHSSNGDDGEAGKKHEHSEKETHEEGKRCLKEDAWLASNLPNVLIGRCIGGAVGDA